MKESLKKAEEAAGTDLRVGSQQVSPWRKDINDRAGKKHDVRTHKERIHSAATLIQVRGQPIFHRDRLVLLESQRVHGSGMSNQRI